MTPPPARRRGRRTGAALLVGATVTMAMLAAVLAALSAPAMAAGLDCVDPWGGRYRLGLQAQPPSLLRCTQAAAAADTPPSTGPRAEAVAPSGGELILQGWAGVAGLQVLVERRTDVGSGAVAPQSLQPLIADAARAFGHDERLLNAIVYVESAFDPAAVSPKGAIGLMQLMPATAERMGVDDRRALFDPAANLRAGARYLRLLVNQFAGRPDLAIAAYNAGEGAVMKYGRVPPYPETQEYVRKVLLHAGPATIR